MLITIGFFSALELLQYLFILDIVLNLGDYISKQCKANITLVEGHWQHKVSAHQINIKDGLEPRFSNDMTIFIPKLTPKYTKPCVFFHLKNRNSRCYLRCSSPFELANALEDLARTLRSDAWFEKWDRIQDVSERLIVDDLLIDEDYLDMPLFEQDIENRPQ